RTELRKNLSNLRDQQASLKKARQSKQEDINLLQNSIKKKISDLKALQSKNSFRSLAELEEYISKQERKVESGKLKVIEEKKILSEISQLKKSKKSFDIIMDIEDSLEEDRQKLDAIRSGIDEAKSKAINAEYDEIKAKLDELNLSNNEEWTKKSKLFEKRDEIRKKIDEQYEKRREIIGNHKKANDEFYNWKREETKRRQEVNEARRQQEEKERIEELIKEELALAELPAFETEIAQCGTLLSYFHRILGSSETNGKAESPKAEPQNVSTARQVDASNQPQGTALVKKSDRDDVFFMGNKVKKSSKKPSSKASSKPAAFTIPLSIMDALSSLKLPIPTSSTGVPDLLTAIQKKIEFFKLNQEKASIEKRKRAQEKIEELKAKHGLNVENGKENEVPKEVEPAA
ncbi:hypothetical protein K502DRAFT_290493, partial [Neoconidiobolus thromboides FSU 785]